MAWNDCHAAFAGGAGSPRTAVLGHFVPSLRDCSWLLSLTQDFVLGYTLPSLRDWLAICLSADLFSANAVHTC